MDGVGTTLIEILGVDGVQANGSDPWRYEDRLAVHKGSLAKPCMGDIWSFSIVSVELNHCEGVDIFQNYLICDYD